ncbi:MAG TPA: SWIM zinc finger family protein [Polyangium sp.]|jgi:uncharacterized Zn finger protein|nr:SWIM zinc finger family protein [Polyangium sp.]
MQTITTNEVQALAPDARAFADAKKIAKISAWRRLGRDGDAIWGVALGSKGDAYAVYARATNDVRCSCPSRKKPCKHALALLLVAAGGHAFVEEALPEGHRYA